MVTQASHLRRRRQIGGHRSTSLACGSLRAGFAGLLSGAALELLLLGLALDAELGHRARAQPRYSPWSIFASAASIFESRPCSRSRRRPANWSDTSDDAMSISSGKSSG